MPEKLVDETEIEEDEDYCEDCDNSPCICDELDDEDDEDDE